MTTNPAAPAESGKLSPHATRMMALRDQVLHEWVQRVQATVKESRHLPHPILIDTFPGMYADIAQAISPDCPRLTSTSGNSVASEHGGERARLTNYDAQAVIAEYQILRWAIFDVLHRDGVQLDNGESAIINACIDDAIREAANAFALAQAALRERFVAGLTHDLRNPLASASIAADLIAMSSSEPKTRDMAARIADNLARMDSMISDLLDSVVFQSGTRMRLHLETFDMLALAREVVDQFALREDGIVLTGAAIAGTWDRRAIKRALENLVGNAVKYRAPGTPVSVHVACQQGRMIATVHNQGEPIPPGQAELVFQMFRRSASAEAGGKPGWGLGLPFVRAAAESHGGSVGFDSAADRGTTFMIDLPIDARPFLDAPTLARSTD